MRIFNFLIGLLVLTFYSCSENEIASELNGNANKKLPSSQNYGVIHNDFMSFAYNDFVLDENITTKNDAYNSVTSFFQEKLESYNGIDESQKGFFNDVFDENQLFLETSNLQGIIKNEINIENPIRASHTTLSVLIDDLHQANVISNREFEKLLDFQETLSKVYPAEISETDFTDYLKESANKIENESVILRTMIDIGIHSNEWWNNNTPDIYLPNPIGEVPYPSEQYQTYALPAVVGTDIAGALVGGVMSAGIQYAVNGDVNWTIVGASAVGGAIVGSTGVVGKLGKWISSLF